MRIYHVGLEGKKNCVHIMFNFYFCLRVFIASLENPSFYLKLVKTIQRKKNKKKLSTNKQRYFKLYFSLIDFRFLH